jgi:hypothetical protein
MALHRTPATARQKLEPTVETRRQIPRVHGRYSGRGQLQRERYSVELATHLRDGVSVLVSQRKVVLDRASALDEELRRVCRGDLSDTATWRGRGQRGHRQDAFTVDPQTFPACRQHRYARTRPLEGLDQGRRRRQQVLTVVEHQQQLLAVEKLHQRLLERLPAPRHDVEHGRHRIDDRLAAAYRRQLAQPRAVPEARQHLGRDLQRQPRFPHTANAGQRHHPRLLQRRERPSQLAVAAHQRRHLQRQVARERIHRPQRRERRAQTRRIHLIHVLGT